MGILCELFVADPQDASHYAVDDEEYDFVSEVESFPLGGMNSLHFESLWALIEGHQWDPTIHAFERVGEAPEKQAHEWRYRFPQAFVTPLAALKQEDLTQIATDWAQLPDLDCDPEQILPGPFSGAARRRLSRNLRDHDARARTVELDPTIPDT